jgi:hypothetical protein
MEHSPADDAWWDHKQRTQSSREFLAYRTVRSQICIFSRKQLLFSSNRKLIQWLNQKLWAEGPEMCVKKLCRSFGCMLQKSHALESSIDGFLPFDSCCSNDKWLVFSLIKMGWIKWSRILNSVLHYNRPSYVAFFLSFCTFHPWV